MERQGSVRRAREMLEAGRRHEPQADAGVPPLRRDVAHMTQWPLPTENSQMNMVDSHVRHLTPQGPPPQRPPRPDMPSPSVYSERSVPDVAPSPLHIKRPVPSFSQPLSQSSPPRVAVQQPPPPSPSSVAASTPRVSVATEDPLRHSTVSSAASMASIPDFPFPAQRLPADPSQRNIANLAPPIGRQVINRVSSVSPIPEERSDSKGSYASSRAIPSWTSAKAESEILGTYLDGISDEDGEPDHAINGNSSSLVRQASIGKRGQPSVCMIRRSTAESPVPPPEDPARLRPAAPDVPPPSFAKEISTGKARRGSFLTSSSDSSHFDLDKAPFVLDVGQQHPEHVNSEALAKEIEVFPRAMPTMSDKRPGGRRPPPLNMGAVRDAEKRGSLTSLPDLIRRATKLATNLEHGRTASRNDLLGGGPSRFQFGHQHRGSGSIKDILASFPPPAATPENGHSSWPFFFRRSTLHQLNSRESGPREVQEKEQKRPRRCCGMPLRLFIILCVVFFIIVLIAVLVPIFVVAVPKHKAASAKTGCAKTAPCENGGVSVSSGDVCSCVCANGYTGSRCTIAGDASCTTTQIDDDSESRNATMGSEIPRLFEDSQNNYSIPLDPLTIMALFSQNNVSCTTENALVSFRNVSNNKARRSLPVDLPAAPLPEDQIGGSIPTATPDNVPTRTLAARGSTSTMDGIIFDGSEPTEVHGPPTSTTPSTTKESSADSSTATATTTPTPTATVSTEVLDFSRIAVLYIFEKTGTLDAAMLSEEKIETYLTGPYPSSKDKYTIDLANSGVKGNYTLNFERFQITSPSGDVVGGK
ncbi:hypothetical protein P875_00109034 [Aspergillus parasiticus SU-1]|uniref:EGF-like domain-containing protein n=1 Tax=Aspergillus parasiticus (strain ATCC 56775 / NRRL 5862 / SRRC 143 / SU-1) TaxID=1403190 RepID=A0A0F0IJ77_ASPPU|nr:hypothetical protein P875_00109034 [Aspergillus parasiticus SU-1]